MRLDYYDGAGNRVGQVTRNGIDTYTYDGLNVVFEANVTSHSTTLTKRFFAGGDAGGRDGELHEVHRSLLVCRGPVVLSALES